MWCPGDTLYIPTEYEKIHYSLNEALGRAGQVSYTNMKQFVRLEKADWVGVFVCLFLLWLQGEVGPGLKRSGAPKKGAGEISYQLA